MKTFDDEYYDRQEGIKHREYQQSGDLDNCTSKLIHLKEFNKGSCMIHFDENQMIYPIVHHIVEDDLDEDKNHKYEIQIRVDYNEFVYEFDPEKSGSEALSKRRKIALRYDEGAEDAGYHGGRIIINKFEEIYNFYLDGYF